MLAPIDIFISHSSKDNEFCRALVENLHTTLKTEQHEFTIWYDITHIHPGELWPQKISDALNRCSIFLLIMSSDAMRSEWTARECAIALAIKKLIIPVLLEDCENEIWPMVAALQRIDFRNSNTRALQNAKPFTDLCRAILVSLRQPSQQVPSNTGQATQAILSSEPSPKENVMLHMLTGIQQNFDQQRWNDVIAYTDAFIRSFDGVVLPRIYYIRGIAFSHQNKLPEADEALSLALSVVDDDQLRLDCLRGRIEVLQTIGGHWKEINLLAQDALQVRPQDPYWLKIARQSKENLGEEEQNRHQPSMPLTTFTPPIPLPTPKPFNITWSTFEGHRGTICDLAWSPDGYYLASAGTDARVYIWEINKTEEDIVKKHVFIYKGHKGVVNTVAWSPKEPFLASAGRDNTVQVWQINQEEPVALWKHKSWVNDVAWSPSGFLVASACNDHRVWIWDVTRTQPLSEIDLLHTNEVHCVRWSPDGRYIAAGCVDGRIYIWHFATRSQVNILLGNKECIYDLTWMPDGKRLASASADKTVRIWYDVTGKSPHPGKNTAETTSGFIECEHNNPVFALTRSRHGRRIASTDGHFVRVWYAIDTQSKIFTNPVHNGRVWAVAWAPDDRHIASAGEDRLIQVWSIVEDKDSPAE